MITVSSPGGLFVTCSAPKSRHSQQTPLKHSGTFTAAAKETFPPGVVEAKVALILLATVCE